ncbi:MAG: hypothetical protein J3Q66DRAFT_436381 [Benniella sp.]|nr:MAG: hypothetical protein J3Q66DRAFT_436381 [Benniella sp.]
MPPSSTPSFQVSVSTDIGLVYPHLACFPASEFQEALFGPKQFAPNFISFHDLSPEARILWASPTVYDALGYEPEELAGKCGYDLVYPEDYSEGKEFHKESFIHDLVASQLIVRYKAKDGRPVPCLCVVSLCYDFAVNSTTVLNSGAESYQQRQVYSTLMARSAGSKKEEFERMKRHHQAFAANTWDHQLMEPEARVCLILNRFTRSFIVIYASSACEKVFHMDPDDITGKPILLYIRADDLAPFVEQVNLIKSSTAIAQMRFWFQSPNWPQEIPCEAIIFGAADGIVAVVRRCKPFVRKHLIGSREQYETHSQYSSRSSGSFRWSQQYSSSSGSASSASPSPSTYNSCGFKPVTPPQNVSRAMLDQIRILELDDKRVQPRPISEDYSYLTYERKVVSHVPAFKEVIVQHYDEDDGDDIASGAANQQT